MHQLSQQQAGANYELIFSKLNLISIQSSIDIPSLKTWFKET